MSPPEEYAARRTRQATWTYVRGADTVASAHAMCRPDGRWFVSVDTWDDAAWAPLTELMAADLRQDLYTLVDDGDRPTLDHWRRLGFEVARREITFDVPVDPIASGLGDTRAPDGLALVPADAVDEAELRRLDDLLRSDVPGTDGWVNDPQEFRDYTFDPRHFDPETYLVAVDDEQRAFAGLVRIWVSPGRHRLGLIGVSPGYRRRGVGRALLAAAFEALHHRGVHWVAAEVDGSNVASMALLERIGARSTGGSVELLRPAQR